MSAADRPWWASDADRLAPDEDPVDHHRRARRPAGDPATDAHDSGAGDRTGADEGGDGPTATGPGADPPAWWLPAAEAISRFAREATEHRPADAPTGDPPGSTPRVDACGVCPICVGLRALDEVRPELVGHLAEAVRHLALAVRTAVDAAGDAGEAAPADAATRGRTRGDRLQRIDLDD